MANPTTNYGFVLPTSSDLVTDLPADFDVALQGVDTRLKALQPGTTLGDLAYSSATANTNTRLGVGSTGQVLTVAGGVPTWATASGGSLVKLAGTTFSNVAQQDLDSIFSSTYNAYIVSISGCSAATQGDDLQVQLRHGSTTVSSGYNGAIDIVNYLGSSVITGTGAGASQCLLATSCGASTFPTSATFNVVFPNGGGASSRAQVYGQAMNSLGAEYGVFGYEIGTPETWTGIRIKSSSSNITGAVSVYGLVK
jgi:hypothetical protein